MKRILLTVILLSSLLSLAKAQDETYHFATKDGMDLFMDEYRPAKANMTYEGKTKPTIIYVFGGGFKVGTRKEASAAAWLEKLASDGYRVFSIDYRLGLKNVTGKSGGIAMANQFLRAVELGVEDLFSATAYILENADMLGVDKSNIVISGSSAGAMISLQAEWELCNRTARASVLPEGFNYAGVMSFSGAVLSNSGAPKYKLDPCPTLLLHGTDDKVVVYKQLKILNWCFRGSSKLAAHYAKKKYNYSILRFTGYGHEVAASQMYNYDEEIKFLQEYVMGAKKGPSDRTIDNATMQHWKIFQNRKDIYGGTL